MVWAVYGILDKLASYMELRHLYFQCVKTTFTDNQKVRINADSIDNIMGDKRIDFISMDIEGSEIKALEGARKCIQRWKPTLAVSAYHQLEHLWEIPLLIKEMNCDYDIYFAHHCWNMDDTVCYAKESQTAI